MSNDQPKAELSEPRMNPSVPEPAPGQAHVSNPAIKSVYIIINPASGKQTPVLGVLNNAFQKSDIEWEMFITKKGGDAYELAREAVAAGIDAVAVYGGDGSVMEVASALSGTGVPLAIFPGGTANVMSLELGIPGDLAEASALVCGSEYSIRTIDMGKTNDRSFLLRLGIGFEADLIANAEREAKNRMGWLAYLVSGLQTLPQQRVAHYQITVDGETFEVEGLSCSIANSGNVGIPGVSLSKTMDVSDGLLDVIVIPQRDLGSLLSLAANATLGTEQLPHWQGKRITLEADPAQHVICDGEPIGETSVSAEIVPQSLKVIVPRSINPAPENGQG